MEIYVWLKHGSWSFLCCENTLNKDDITSSCGSLWLDPAERKSELSDPDQVILVFNHESLFAPDGVAF